MNMSDVFAMVRSGALNASGGISGSFSRLTVAAAMVWRHLAVVVLHALQFNTNCLPLRKDANGKMRGIENTTLVRLVPLSAPASTQGNAILEPIPDWWREEALQDGCAYCPADAETLDHVIPVAMGGQSEPGNLVPACRTCNSRKKDTDPQPWIDIMRPEFIENIGVQPMVGVGALELLEDAAYGQD